MNKCKQFNNFYIFIISFFITSFCFAEPELKNAFMDKFNIGVALNARQIKGVPAKEIDLVKKHFNSITAENIMKWEKIHPRENQFDFELVDKFVDFGCDNNMFILGHTLVWHSQTPRWVFRGEEGQPITRDKLLGRMKNHITTVVGHYKGKVDAWDVVNEAVQGNGSLRRSGWSRIIGNDFIEKAFEYAHQADPDAELYYNDYDMWKKDHRNGVIRLVKSLQKKNIRIDGIGMQGHWGLDYPSMDEIEQSILDYSNLGVKVMITELDITVLPSAWNQGGADVSQNFGFKKELNPYPDTLPDEIQTKLANRYAQIFSLFNKHADKISRVTFWGLQDGNSWRNGWPVRGRTDYPLIFDRNCKPKPAFEAIIETVSK